LLNKENRENGMQTHLVFKSTAGTDVSVALGFDALAGTIRSMPDRKEMESYWEILADHSAAEVRETLASKEHLNEATMIKLSEDVNSSVKETLIRSDSFRAWADIKILIKMCRSDPSLARHIASSVGSFNNADTDALVKELATHSDPAVRMELASSWGLSKFSIKSLSKDIDPSVASTAKRTLEDR
jgi:hypothetical protein